MRNLQRVKISFIFYHSCFSYSAIENILLMALTLAIFGEIVLFVKKNNSNLILSKAVQDSDMTNNKEGLKILEEGVGRI